MSINGITLQEGATYTPAGGTNIVFDATGESVANGVVCVNQAETNFFAREKLIATARLPSFGTDGKWSKQKTSVRIVMPKTLASGEVVYELVRVEIESHPEGTNNITALRKLGISALLDAELDNFFLVGSLK